MKPLNLQQVDLVRVNWQILFVVDIKKNQILSLKISYHLNFLDTDITDKPSMNGKDLTVFFVTEVQGNYLV